MFSSPDKPFCTARFLVGSTIGGSGRVFFQNQVICRILPPSGEPKSQSLVHGAQNLFESVQIPCPVGGGRKARRKWAG
jgi:hypothetical protein